ncbi:hypothetical protein SDC9_98995 [bioreactor metagenome]|uniref:Uncharacterized protein n=1 Tax=bioreactor metagenome TaxID=1076179 RepID=A0A645AHQ3_9ZZZZ
MKLSQETCLKYEKKFLRGEGSILFENILCWKLKDTNLAFWLGFLIINK